MTAIATLPMYLFPDNKKAHDMLWSLIYHYLLEANFTNIPSALSQHEDAIYHHGNLLLSQICGYPFVNSYDDILSLIGTPCYHIPAKVGNYFSYIITHKNNINKPINRIAINCKTSQSGYHTLLQYCQENTIKIYDDMIIITESHLESVNIIEDNRADIAAIDAVTMSLLQQFYPQNYTNIKIITQTKETLGLPFVTAKKYDDKKDIIFDALRQAIHQLDDIYQQQLLLYDCVQTNKNDYYRQYQRSS